MLFINVEECKDDDVGETKRRIAERIKDHNSKDNSSHLLKHACENGHIHVWEKDFQTLGNNYQSNFKRKISEPLFIRQLKPTLSVNEKSVPLYLFNCFIKGKMKGKISNMKGKIQIEVKDLITNHSESPSHSILFVALIFP